MLKTKKLRIPVRIQFLIIVLSLAITTTVLGLSAYLTDTDEYTSSFRTVTGNELGFKIVGTVYNNETIVPGDTVPVDASVVIEKANDLYVFIEIDVPSAFIINGFNTDAWRTVPGYTNVYYYGSQTRLVPLGTENGNTVDIFDSLTLSPEVTNGEDFSVNIVGYAIQADYIDASSSPAEVFAMIGD